MKTTFMIWRSGKVVFVGILIFAFIACSNDRETNAYSSQSRSGGQQQAEQLTPTPTPTPSAAKPSPTTEQTSEPDTNAAANIIRSYYAAINAKEYRTAYELWSEKGKASNKTFESFSKGFADTASTEVVIGTVGDEDAAAGSRYVTVPVTIKAKTKSGKEQSFSGEYVLRRSVVDGATNEQRTWRIYSAKIRKQ
ncbi:MAG TPA: hypothetical protein VGQ55_16600 [Pyrinomonadaceae bacterium]|nr:hypothetical protein [Pyrinomonadaceae bacterium]